MRTFLLGILAFWPFAVLTAPCAFAAKHSFADTLPFNIAKDGYVDTPSGRYHSSCVSIVPKGAHIHEHSIIDEDGSVLAKWDKCKYPVLKSSLHRQFTSDSLPPNAAGLFGWIEDRDGTSVYTSGGVSYFDGLEATIVVPAVPSVIVNSSNPMVSQLIFLFPSFEDSSGAAIIQPVLQFGDSSAGGGNYWALAGWYIDDAQHPTTATASAVNAGDTIEMSAYGDSCSSGQCFWEVDAFDSTNGTSEAYLSTSSRAEVMTLVQSAVLEVQRVTACNQLPNSGGATFTGEHFFEPAYLGGWYDQDETASITWGSTDTGSGSSPLCGWGQSGVTSGSSTLSW
jgi:hypothetical protein